MMREEWTKKFADKVFERLHVLSMSQRYLALMSGVSQWSIHHYLKGNRAPSAITVVNMAKVLKIPVSELIDFGEEIWEEETD